MSLKVNTYTHKELDLSATINLVGYTDSDMNSGTISISMAGQVVHSQPITINGETSKEILKEVLIHALKEHRKTEHHRELCEHFRSVAKEFYPIFDGNDPSLVLEMYRPGFESIEEIREWAQREFSAGTEYAVINEFGLVCCYETVPESSAE